MTNVLGFLNPRTSPTRTNTPAVGDSTDTLFFQSNSAAFDNLQLLYLCGVFVFGDSAERAFGNPFDDAFDDCSFCCTAIVVSVVVVVVVIFVFVVVLVVVGVIAALCLNPLGNFRVCVCVCRVHTPPAFRSTVIFCLPPTLDEIKGQQR